MKYIESTHCNGEIKERSVIFPDANIQKIKAQARKRNLLGYNRAWRIENENGEILYSHCDPAFWQYLNG